MIRWSKTALTGHARHRQFADDDTDADDGATLTVSAVNGSSDDVGVGIAGAYGCSVEIFHWAPTSTTWTTATLAANTLPEGATATDDVRLPTVTERRHGDLTSTTLTIHITGATDDAASIGVVSGGDYAVTEAAAPPMPRQAVRTHRASLRSATSTRARTIARRRGSLSGTVRPFTFDTTTGE